MSKITFTVFCAFLLLISVHPISAQKVAGKSKTGIRNKISEFPRLKLQADEMGVAFQTNDYEKFADFMYPKLIELSGGREKFVGILKSATQIFAAEGFKITSYQIGKANQSVKVKDELFVVLPTRITMRIAENSGNSITQNGALLAISGDRGANWKFVRIESRETLKVLFPNAADKLKLPANFIE